MSLAEAAAAAELQRTFFDLYPLPDADIRAVADRIGAHHATVRNWVRGASRIQRDAFDLIVAEHLPKLHPDADPELIAEVRAVANPNRLRRIGRRDLPAPPASVASTPPTAPPAAVAERRLPFDHDGGAMPYTVLVAFLRTARLTPEQRFGLIRVIATGGAS